tara:strand:+ start:437 stop:613 length:177 start_codon:yes stop_codon:yes gene_type:complete
MADITIIQSGSLPTESKEYIQYSKTTSETESYDDVYILRTLIDKINELVEEVNTLKNQ